MVLVSTSCVTLILAHSSQLFSLHEQANSHNQQVLAGSNYGTRKPSLLYNQHHSGSRCVNECVRGWWHGQNRSVWFPHRNNSCILFDVNCLQSHHGKQEFAWILKGKKRKKFKALGALAHVYIAKLQQNDKNRDRNQSN